MSYKSYFTTDKICITNFHFLNWSQITLSYIIKNYFWRVAIENNRIINVSKLILSNF
jgi:hypothetical protein